jgi:hypothetical protein
VRLGYEKDDTPQQIARKDTGREPMSTIVPKHFDADLRNRMAQMQEIQIETQRPGTDAAAHRTTIWVVVAGDAVAVRSVRGAGGRWYQEIRANPRAAVHINGQRVPVRAVAVTDDSMIEQVSDAYRKKYRNDASLPSMVRDEVLLTTLRLEPM